MDKNPQEIMKELQKPFVPSDIEWRVSRTVKTANGPKAVVLAYVTNRAIMNRLDTLFGPFGWRNEYMEWKGQSQLCGISVYWNGEWITKWDGSDNTNIEATKGGLSGAMKRAAVQWGIGRYLYSLTETWADIKNSGENYINAKVKVGNKEEWVKGYWDNPQLPAWALPEEYVEARKEQPKKQKEAPPNWKGFWPAVKQLGFDETQVHAEAEKKFGRKMKSITEAIHTKQQQTEFYNYLKKLKESA